MLQLNFFLRTKLLPPRTASQLLKRPRLTQRLQANLGAPFTMVAADAGCGKTTLIADFLRSIPRPSVWYQLDHTDSDPVVFLNYVAHGIKEIAPDFGDALVSYLRDANEELIRSPERAADLLINEILRSIEQPFVLVLDDYHHIGQKTLVHKIVDRVLQYASEHLHLIITTRDLPPLSVMRRRSQLAALVLTREDLLFTDSEVRDLFAETLGIELSSEQIAEYRNRTHGWITALQLMRQVAEKEAGVNGRSQPLDLSNILQRSEKDIFDYFAEEVFLREDDETRNLLLYLSLLETLPLKQCSLLFPDLRCSSTLPQLAQKNIFLTAVGEGGTSEEYRFHPLFRDFLQRRLRSEIGRSKVNEERVRIAELFLANDQYEMALPFLLDAENYERAASVIAEHGNEWIAAGAIISLGSVVDQVPMEYLEKFPRSLLHKAEIARLQGEIERSTGLLNRAVELFKKCKDPEAEGEALHSLASLARRKGDPVAALKMLGKAEKLVDPKSETYLKCLNTRGLCLILEGNWNEAEQQFRVALDIAEARSNDQYIRLIAHNLALAPGFRGDFGEAIRWFNRIFRNGSNKPFPQEAIGHLNLARLHLYRGEFEKTEMHLERSLELGQLFNLKSLLPEIFETYGNFYREKGDAPHAAEFYERSITAYHAAGVDPSTREINEERAKYFLSRGDTIRARALLEALVEARLKQNSELALNTARLCICQVDLTEGKTDGLVERITELVTFFNRQNHYYDEALASMLLAETYHDVGKTKEMVAAVHRVLDLSARFDYEYWLRGQIRRNRAIFEHEDVLEKLPPDLREELGAAVTQQTPVAVTEISAPVTDLTINVLGHAEIYRDPSKPFAPDAWTTRRARDIFCFIATRKNRRVPKDVLIDTFWSAEDPDTIEKNFHPTISHIRKALNSRQTLKQNFIVFRDGAYQLNPEFTYRIDTEEFMEHVADAQSAKRAKNDDQLRQHLEAAYALYRGEFMEGLYEDWAEEPRAFYRDNFSRVLNALAKLAVADKRWNDALNFSGQILTIDPYREDLHRLVMKVLAAQSKISAVKKHYDDMQKVLKDELGVEPSAETKRVFAGLMK